MDSLIFLPDTVKAASARQVSESQEPKKETSIEEPEVEIEVENVERPVDLYKAIFSDDSEDDEDQPMNGKIQEGQEKKNEAAATTLNRLIAGDFLESLGKELGLEVPSDVPYQEGTKPVEEESKSRSKPKGSSDKRSDRSGFKEKAEKTSSLTLGSEEEKSRKKREKSPRKRSGGNDLSSRESSGDERSKKRSNKKDRYRNNDSESDSSSDYHNRDKQGSRRKRRESSREKRSSHKKHSKHHRSKKSSSSRYSSEEERKESRREKRRRRD